MEILNQNGFFFNESGKSPPYQSILSTPKVVSNMHYQTNDTIRLSFTGEPPKYPETSEPVGTVVTRPWGTYEILPPEKEGTKEKKIIVNPGGKLSLQSHEHRSEVWTVEEGKPSIIVSDDLKEKNLIPEEYSKGDIVEIAKGQIHRLINNTNEPVVIKEIQYGDYLGEDDIIRYEDIYGRTDKK